MAQTTDGAKQKTGLLGEEPGFLRAIRPAPRKRSWMAQTKIQGESDYLKVA